VHFIGATPPKFWTGAIIDIKVNKLRSPDPKANFFLSINLSTTSQFNKDLGKSSLYKETRIF